MLVTLPAQAGRIASADGPVLLSTPGEPLRQPVHLHSVGAMARLIYRSTRAPAAMWDGLAGAPGTAAGLLTQDLFHELYGFVRGCWAMLSGVPCAKEEGVSSCRSSEAALGPALPGAGQRGFTKLISTDFPSPVLYKSEKQGDKKMSFVCPSFLRLKM